jgi:hypothetical protein
MTAVALLTVPMGYVGSQAKIVSERRAILKRVMMDRRVFVKTNKRYL